MFEAESRFELDELFFSKTNLKGTIESGNDVFVRVSEYEKHEILNKPHSIIRHQDTPRAVFKVFWNFLSSKKPIVAYVKNRSKSGRYYWVLAMAFPMEDGYLSIRLKPTSALFSQVQKIYDQVGYSESINSDLDQSVQMLSKSLENLGFASYDDFMRVALIEEMISRDRHLSCLKGTEFRSSKDVNRSSVDGLIELINGCTTMTRQAFGKTQALADKMDSLVENSEAISRACATVKFITINLSLSSGNLGDVGRALGVVSVNLETLTKEIADSTAEFERAFKAYSISIRDMYFSIATSRFQIDMMKHLADEVIIEAKETGQFTEQHEEFLFSNCKLLQSLVVDSFGKVSEITKQLYETNQFLLKSIHNLRKIITGMSVLHIMGKIELARLKDDTSSISSRLQEMEKLTETLKINLRNLEVECSEGTILCKEILHEVNFVKNDIHHIGTTASF